MNKTKKLTLTAMLAALAYIVVVFCRVPAVAFLSYEPKDVIITIAGFIMGPMTAFTISTLVSLVEMVTISDTGTYGFLMNVISTVAFACTATVIYKNKRTMQGAVIGLVMGVAIMTPIMMLWNYLITPIYMGVEREVVAGMLIPVFLPFNLLKGILNAAITLILYKPIVSALRKAKILPPSETGRSTKRFAVTAVSVIVVITCILAILAMNGKL